jgi:hypothetical protein
MYDTAPSRHPNNDDLQDISELPDAPPNNNDLDNAHECPRFPEPSYCFAHNLSQTSVALPQPVLPPCSTGSTFYATTSQEFRMQTRIADLLDFANCPLYLMDELFLILKEEARQGINLSSCNILKRKLI